MKKFFASNPGLKSRFNTFIEFDDYNADELEEILISMCSKNDYVLDEEVKKKIHQYFEQQVASKDENFANGRLVRNLYDNLVMNQARRVITMTNPQRIDLSTIKAEDFTSFKVKLKKNLGN
jgi:stage V sporulation protein K